MRADSISTDEGRQTDEDEAFVLAELMRQNDKDFDDFASEFSERAYQGDDRARVCSDVLVEDIRSSLEMVFASEQASEQHFAFSKTYTNAPNPGLVLKDVGIIGLPLNPREANVIKSCCVPPPPINESVPKAEDAVGYTWELDACPMTCTGPHWDKFLARVTKEVCVSLGVNIETAKSRCELSRLLLCEAGSRSPVRLTTDYIKGQFATIRIVLPSEFSGGTHHLSRGGTDIAIDGDSASAYATTAIASYTGTVHEVEEISSGFCFVLEYRLILIPPTLHAALSSIPDQSATLHMILRSWNDLRDTSPQKLIYLLSQDYSQDGPGLSVLQGSDAHKLALIESVAKVHSFKLGLASASRRTVSSSQGIQGTIMVENLVSLDGRPILKTLDCQETEFIPSDFVEALQSGPFHSVEFKHVEGIPSLTKWFRRTVLVMWPSVHGSIEACDEEASVNNARIHIRSIAHEATHGAKEHTPRVPKHQRNTNGAAGSACQKASDRENAKLWVEGIEACVVGGLKDSLKDDSELRGAVERLGFEVVRPSLEAILRREPQNLRRLAYLTNLTEWLSASEDAELSSRLRLTMTSWIAMQGREILKSFGPVAVSESEAFVKAVSTYGGIVFMKDEMLAGLTNLSDAETLLEIASLVFKEPNFPDGKVKVQVVADLMAAVITKTVYPPNDIPSQLDVAVQILMVCTELRCEYLIPAMFDRISQVQDLKDAGAVQDYARQFIIPFIARVVRDIPRSSSYLQSAQFRSLRERGVALALDGVESCPTLLTRELLGLLLDVTTVDVADLFATTIIPRLSDITLPGQVAHDIATELRARHSCLKFRESYIGPGADGIIRIFDTKYIEGLPVNNHKEITYALTYCTQHNLPEAGVAAVGRAMRELAPNEHTLLPAVPFLRAWGAHANCLEALADIFQRIFASWMATALGPLPIVENPVAEQLAKLSQWPCQCNPCLWVVHFLTYNNDRTLALESIGATNRKHVEGLLLTCANVLVSWETLWTRPQGLKLYKTDSVDELLRWRCEHARGNAALNALSTSDAELRMLLGVQYHPIVETVRGIRPAEPGGDLDYPPSSPSRSDTLLSANIPASIHLQSPRSPAMSLVYPDSPLPSPQPASSLSARDPLNPLSTSGLIPNGDESMNAVPSYYMASPSFPRPSTFQSSWDDIGPPPDVTMRLNDLIRRPPLPVAISASQLPHELLLSSPPNPDPPAMSSGDLHSPSTDKMREKKRRRFDEHI